MKVVDSKKESQETADTEGMGKDQTCHKMKSVAYEQDDRFGGAATTCLV